MVLLVEEEEEEEEEEGVYGRLETLLLSLPLHHLQM